MDFRELTCVQEGAHGGGWSKMSKLRNHTKVRGQGER
jgi:hypothetical protein